MQHVLEVDIDRLCRREVIYTGHLLFSHNRLFLLEIKFLSKEKDFRFKADNL